VRTAGYGLDKSARRQQRAGVKAAATAEQVQRRGDDEFVERVRERAAAGHGRLTEAFARMPKFEQITAAVEKLKGEKWMDFRDRRNDRGRDLALYLARRHTGLKLDDLGRVCELDGRTVGWAVERFTRRIANDQAIAAAVKIVTARITQ
jgi:hypothetical protein